MAVRITQIPIETSIAPNDGTVRVTQVAIESSMQSNQGAVRVTQIVIETSITHVPGHDNTIFFVIV